MSVEPAIAQLYQAFRSYRRRTTIGACPHCVGRADQDRIASVALHHLSPEQLARYAFKAITTWGQAVDYKHFLPRILEISTGNAVALWPGFDLSVIAGKLALADWRSWPVAEQTAVRDVFAAVWDMALATDPEEGRWVARTLLLPCLAILDAERVLRRWHETETLTAALQLADLVDGKPPALVGDWLRDVERSAWLARCFAAHMHHAAAERLAEGMDALEQLRAGGRGR
jgi:hypothetical protein